MKAVKMQPSEERNTNLSAKIIPLRSLKGNLSSQGYDDSPLDEKFFGKPLRLHLREFAATFGAIMCIIAAVQLYRGKPYPLPAGFAVGSLFLYLIGIQAPLLLKPLWRGWMGLAHVLGMVSTFILLSACWMVVVLPMALVLKLVGKRVMTMGFRNPEILSYWETKSEASHDFKLLERQF